MTRNDAMAYRSKIEAAASTMTDETALTAVELFPKWAVGKPYAVSDRVQYNGKLYKCVQAHTMHITVAIKSATTASTTFARPTQMSTHRACTDGMRRVDEIYFLQHGQLQRRAHAAGSVHCDALHGKQRRHGKNNCDYYHRAGDLQASTNPYNKGDKIKHNGKTLESEIGTNVLEPGIYGWKEIQE